MVLTTGILKFSFVFSVAYVTEGSWRNSLKWFVDPLFPKAGFGAVFGVEYERIRGY